jgi:hypothetical protein
MLFYLHTPNNKSCKRCLIAWRWLYMRPSGCLAICVCFFSETADQISMQLFMISSCAYWKEYESTNQWNWHFESLDLLKFVLLGFHLLLMFVLHSYFDIKILLIILQAQIPWCDIDLNLTLTLMIKRLCWIFLKYVIILYLMCGLIDRVRVLNTLNLKKKHVIVVLSSSGLTIISKWSWQVRPNHWVLLKFAWFCSQCVFI